MTDSIENIGLMIRNERLRKGLTQEELGKRIGVGKVQISKIESGKGLTIKTITKVLDALGMYASVILQNTQAIDKNVIVYIGKHSKKCTFYTLRFGCSFAAVNTIKPQLL